MGMDKLERAFWASFFPTLVHFLANKTGKKRCGHFCWSFIYEIYFLLMLLSFKMFRRYEIILCNASDVSDVKIFQIYEIFKRLQNI